MALDKLLVARVGGADEVTVRQFQPGGESFPDPRQFITISLRVLALRLGDLLDFLAVLVQAGEEENLLPKGCAAHGR